MAVTDEPVLEEPEAGPGPLPEEFHALLVVEGLSTEDGPPRRMFSPGALTWPAQPIPVMLKLDQDPDGHDSGMLAGAITRIERRGSEIHGWGYSDMGSEYGIELDRLITAGAPIGVSIQPDQIADADIELLFPEGGDPAVDLMAEPEQVVFHAGRIREVTVLPVPAQVETYIEAGQGAPAAPAPVLAAAPPPFPPPADDEPPVGPVVAVGDRVTWQAPGDPAETHTGEVVAVSEDGDTATVADDAGGEVDVPVADLEPVEPEPDEDEPVVVASATDAEQSISERFAAFLDRQRASIMAAAEPEVAVVDESAAPAVTTSGMIALVPSPDDAGRLALEGAEPAEELHVTLAFLGGDVTGLDDAGRAALDAGLAELAGGIEGVDGQLWATGHFNPTGDEPAAVYLVGDDSGRLAGLQRDAADLATQAGLTGEEHSPWVPHLTVAYGGDPAALAEVGTPVGFDRLRLALGDQITDYPLAGETVEDLEEPVPVNDEDVLIASAAPSAPPAEWFSDPGLTRPTPLTVTADGRVFGHLATWGTCHTGYGGACVTPPREKDLGYYTTGEVLCAGGERVPVGHITLGTGHAGQNDSAMSAARHYDDTGACVADVAAGNDRHGIWFAGSLRAGVEPEQVHVLRASALSGDWRRIGGSLRLVAALAVNVPGFPIPRTRAMVASGVQTALVAAAVVDRATLGNRYMADLIARDIGRDPKTRAAALVASVHPEQSE